MNPDITYTLNKKVIPRIILEDNFFIIATIPASLFFLLIVSCFLGIPFLGMALGAIAVTAVTELLLGIIIILYSCWVKSCTPAKIILSPEKIRVDEKIWPLNEIEEITLTSNIYPMNKKCYLTITGLNGEKENYFLGYGYGTQFIIFSEYQALCDDVAFICKDEPGKFQPG